MRCPRCEFPQMKPIYTKHKERMCEIGYICPSCGYSHYTRKLWLILAYEYTKQIACRMGEGMIHLLENTEDEEEVEE